MKKSFVITYGLLLLFTLTTALLATYFSMSQLSVALIMGVSSIKFLLVAYQFMELKKAHSLWKTSVLLTVGLLFLVLVFMK